MFSPCREQEGETTYFERLNDYFVKQINTVDLGPFRLLQPLVLIIESQLLKAEVEDCIGREAL